MNFIRIGYAFLIIIIGSSSSFATPSNKAISFTQELYETCPEFLDPLLAIDVEEIISRVSMVKSTESNLPLISSFDIKTKCLNNTNLLEHFNPETFNYYLYYINFWHTEVQKIRIDNTEYILIIQPFSN